MTQTNQPTEKQLSYIESLLGKPGNAYHSDAWAEIRRVTGAAEKKATRADASATIDALKSRRAS